MSATFVLPKKDYEQVVVVNTPLAVDVAVANGAITFKDEAGINALSLRFSDIIAGKKFANAAGSASTASIVLTNVSIVNNGRYELVVSLPNRKDFFLYGQEYNPLLLLRTYSVSLDASATVDELGVLFASAINADLEAGFTAGYTAGTDTLLITADSVDAGKFVVTAPAGAATTIAYTEPVGTISEVEVQAPGKSLAGTSYNRFEFKAKKLIKHNAVSGLSVYKTVKYAIYAATGVSAYDNEVDGFLAGNIGTATATTIRTDTTANLATDLRAALAFYLSVPSL
jgi:hypothetical protein